MRYHPIVLPILGYLLAMALGLPSLLARTRDVLRGRGAEGAAGCSHSSGPRWFSSG